VITTIDPQEKQAVFVNLLQDYLYKDVALLLKDGDMLHFRRLLGVLATRV
jgi:small nuclear ribonucleoprotein (snRNP)-like protein